MTAAAPGSEVKAALGRPTSTLWRAGDLTLTTRRPSPPPGAARNALRAQSQRQLDAIEAAIEADLLAMWDRQAARVEGRLRGRKSRRWTRHWGGGHVVTKTLDPDYILDAETVKREAQRVGQRAVTRAFGTAAGQTARRLGQTDPQRIGLDSPLVQDAITRAVQGIVDVSEARAQMIRDVILRADSTDADLDEIVKQVRGSYAQRQAWAKNAARTQATHASGAAGMGAAAAAGAMLAQWLSSDDERVRPTHGIADGQVAAVGATFRVGKATLRWPGDLAAAEAHPEEVLNCRCTLLFAKPRRSNVRPAGPAGLTARQVDASALPPKGERDGGDRGGSGDSGERARMPVPSRALRNLLLYRAAAKATFPETLPIGSVLSSSQADLLFTRLPSKPEVTVEVEVPEGARVMWDGDAGALIVPGGARYEVVSVSADLVRLRLLV